MENFFLPAVGWRTPDSSLGQHATATFYWSSVEQNGGAGRCLSSGSSPDCTWGKGGALSIRCVRKPTFFLPALGQRQGTDGSLARFGEGIYWSSTQHIAEGGYALHFTSSNSYPSAGGGPMKQFGFTVRCVR